MLSRLSFFSVLVALSGPSWAQQMQADDAMRAQRRIELRHAIEAQRAGAQRPPMPSDPGHSLSAEQRAQLREDVRRQYGPPSLRQEMAPPSRPVGGPGGRP